jgi:hypothetical protein
VAIIALHAIARTRKRIARKLARGEGDKRALRRALAHLDATAALLANPDSKLVRKRVVRYVLAALRQRPMATGELTRVVCNARCEDHADRETRARVRRRVEDALYELKRRGLLGAAGKPLAWRIAAFNR